MPRRAGQTRCLRQPHGMVNCPALVLLIRGHQSRLCQGLQLMCGEWLHHLHSLSWRCLPRLMIRGLLQLHQFLQVSHFTTSFYACIILWMCAFCCCYVQSGWLVSCVLVVLCWICRTMHCINFHCIVLKCTVLRAISFSCHINRKLVRFDQLAPWTSEKRRITLLVRFHQLASLPHDKNFGG